MLADDSSPADCVAFGKIVDFNNDKNSALVLYLIQLEA